MENLTLFPSGKLNTIRRLVIQIIADDEKENADSGDDTEIGEINNLFWQRQRTYDLEHLAQRLMGMCHTIRDAVNNFRGTSATKLDNTIQDFDLSSVRVNGHLLKALNIDKYFEAVRANHALARRH